MVYFAVQDAKAASDNNPKANVWILKQMTMTNDVAVAKCDWRQRRSRKIQFALLSSESLPDMHNLYVIHTNTIL